MNHRINQSSSPPVNSGEPLAQAQQTDRAVTTRQMQQRRFFAQHKGAFFRTTRSSVGKSANSRSMPPRRPLPQTNQPVLNANQHLPIATPHLAVSRDGGGQGRGQSHQEQQEQKRKKENSSIQAKRKIGYSQAAKFSYHAESESSTSGAVTSVRALARQEEKSQEETPTQSKNPDAYGVAKTLSPASNLAQVRELLMKNAPKENRKLEDIPIAEQHKNLLAPLTLLPPPLRKTDPLKEAALRKAREKMFTHRGSSIPNHAAPAA
ncbi:Short-chain dehydrogenase [Mycoavidus cysteinexigens]|uniref:Short-chain dehydrogenase n=1 Tax=Mycoavidus cysteinexigens TaxID=1553431 RepID=A0A2Z6EU42_9BURK|nr:hypothetical protein [Mycoavidus cysteinexigens]BBE08922.1 Short-chain dehydrogenase [Mycoavidus cysteinexigens]GAM52355.1 hypothetical protein EBME_0818 [bacterium endosymbiont of Mortierella elongata FMR23-6]GLR01234.1 hypothetical protein GCM10007934_10460 [Mycoavidus cysteinexigens]